MRQARMGMGDEGEAEWWARALHYGEARVDA